MNDKDKNRDEITGKITDRQLNDLSAPWLSMAQAPPQPNYNLPPGTPGMNGELRPMTPNIPGVPQPTMSATPYAYGSGGSDDYQRRMQLPYGAIGMRLGVQY